jgi:hypothetical protein
MHQLDKIGGKIFGSEVLDVKRGFSIRLIDTGNTSTNRFFKG